MKVALVQMPQYPRDTPPLEVALTAAVLRAKGHQVFVFDINNELYHEVFKSRPYWKYQLTDHSVEPHEAIFRSEGARFEKHARLILERSPEAVVFKVESAYPNAAHMARVLKKLSARTVVIASGRNHADPAVVRHWKKEEQYQVGAEGEALMPFDHCILGEDDIALPELLSALSSGGMKEFSRRFSVDGKIIDARNGPHVENLDELPFYDFTDYDFMRYGDPQSLRFSVSRSCIKHCAFCMDWVVGRKYRTVSGDRWFEEYRVQHERHPQIAHYQYYDRLLNGDIAVLDRYVERLLSHYGPWKDGMGGPPVVWAGDFIIRPEMTEELIGKMAMARCIGFGTGVESGSEKARAAVFKDFFTNDRAARVFESCRRHGIAVWVNILIGIPGETHEDFLESIRFIENNAGNISDVRLTSPTVQLQPGTPLSLNPLRFGIGTKERETWSSLDGSNDYAERVGRFEAFCLRMLNIPNMRLAVNRRIVKNASQVRHLVEECRKGLVEAGV